MKPDIKVDGEIVKVELPVGLDLDKDQKQSLSLKLVLEADKGELIQELAGKLLEKSDLPGWVKPILEKALGK